MTRTDTKVLLSSIVAMAVLMGVAFAQPFQPEADDEDAIASRGSEWSLDVNITYSDNYRRLPELLDRFDVDGPTGLLFPTETEIDPIDNVIVSSSLRGNSFIRSKKLTGFVSGSLRVGGYLNGTDDDRDLVANSVPAAPFSNEPEADGSVSTYAISEVDELFIVPDLVGAATAELSEGRFYVDVSGLAQERSVGRSSVTNRRSNTPGSDTITYVGGSVSPYLFREYGDRQTFEVRTRGTAIIVADERANSDNAALDDDLFDDSDRLANDSYSVELSSAYNAGSRYDSFTYGVSGRVRHISETGSDVLPELYVTELSARADGAYAISQAVQLTASVGYDDITLNFDDADEAAEQREEDDLNGVYWNVGVKYTPSRRADLEISAGQRYGGPSVEGRLRLRPTERITFNASALRVLDTGGQEFGRVLNGLQTRTRTILTSLSAAQDELAPRLLNDVLGVQPLGRGQDQEFRSGIFVFDRYAASVLAQFRRNSFGAGASYNSAEAGGTDDETVTLTAFARRQLSRRLSFNTSYTYARNEGLGVISSLDGTVLGTGDRSSTDHFVRAGFDYAINRRLTGLAEVTYAVNDSDGVAANTGPGFDFEETAISIGLRWAF
ncbi:MAG: hypothetical protein AAGA69_00105 [Pseudomonadota bacterium]